MADKNELEFYQSKTFLERNPVLQRIWEGSMNDIKNHYIVSTGYGLIAFIASIYFGLSTGSVSSILLCLLATFGIPLVFIFVKNFIVTPVTIMHNQKETIDEQAIQIQQLEREKNRGLIKSNIPEIKEKQEMIAEQLKPEISIQITQTDVIIYGNQNLIYENARRESNAVLYGIQFRFQPTINISGSVELEGYIKTNNNSIGKGVWLNNLKTETELSVGESDKLILAVKRYERFIKRDRFFYLLGSYDFDGMESHLNFSYSPLPDTLLFEVEYICKHNNTVIKVETLKLNLSETDNTIQFDLASNESE